MTQECQLNYEISDREIQLYFFDVHEVAQMLHFSRSHTRRLFSGKMTWYDNRWMINPSDIQKMRKK